MPPQAAAAWPLLRSLRAGCASLYAGARHGVARGGTCAALGGESFAVAALAWRGLRRLLRWRASRCGAGQHVCRLRRRRFGRCCARSAQDSSRTAANGATSNGAWIEKVSLASVDSMQSANAPRVDHDASAAELFAYMSNGANSRQSPLMREWTEETNPPDPRAARTPPRQQAPVITAPAPAAAAPNLQPLSQTNAVGRRVLVPADIYPTYRCSEQQGRGWECTVMTVRLSLSLVLKLSKSGSGVWSPFPLSLDHIWKSGFHLGLGCRGKKAIFYFCRQIVNNCRQFVDKKTSNLFKHLPGAQRIFNMVSP